MTLEEILENHGLKREGAVKSQIGFLNEVWITADAAVKIYRDNVRACERERWLYEKKPFFAPRLIGAGEGYLVLERICGSGLYHLWPKWSHHEREHAVWNVAQIMRELCSKQIAGAPLDAPSDWRTYILNQLKGRVENGLAQHALPVALARRVLGYAQAHGGALEGLPIGLGYNDLHFDNLIMDGAGKLYLIDYESLCAAPKDFILDVPRRMSAYPFLYANERDHAVAVREDYTDLMPWLRAYAPEFFLHPRLEERLALYALSYDLHILSSYPMDAMVLERMEENLRVKQGLDH